jgi:GH35 family endo-1,4-beta-xylanase
LWQPAREAGLWIGCFNGNQNTALDNANQAIMAREYDALLISISPNEARPNNRNTWVLGDWDSAMSKVKAMSPPKHCMNYGMLRNGAAEGYMPQWWMNLGNNAAQQQSAMYEHLDIVVPRYANEFSFWCAFNEVLEDPLGPWGANRGRWNWDTNQCLNYIGWERMLNTPDEMPKFLRLSAERIRSQDDDAAMIALDRWNEESTDPLANTFAEMVQALKQAGTPIEAAGLQLHTSVRANASVYDKVDYLPNLRAQLERYNEMGLDIYITEYDCRIDDRSQANLDKQAAHTRGIFRALLAQPRVRGIFMWGASDVGAWEPQSYPTMFHNGDYGRAAKPAYYTIQDELEKAARRRATDGLSGFSKVYSRSSGWRTDTSNLSADSNHAQRTSDTTQSLVWRDQDIRDFHAVVHLHNGYFSLNKIKFYSSADGSTYSAIPLRTIGKVDAGGGWRQVRIHPKNPMSSGVSYLKMEFEGALGASWTPLLSSISIRSALTDDCNDFSNIAMGGSGWQIVDQSGEKSFQRLSSVGDSTQFIRWRERPGLWDFAVKMRVHSYTNKSKIQFWTTADGTNWTHHGDVQWSSGKDVGGGWSDHWVYPAGDLPANTKQFQIQFLAGAGGGNWWNPLITKLRLSH